MHTITVVALGPGNPAHITLGALRCLKSGKTVVLRTEKHGAVPLLYEEGIVFSTLDDLYESQEDFDLLGKAAAERLLSLGADEDLVYGVADPLTDATVTALLQAAEGRAEVRLQPGVTQENACRSALPGIEGRNGGMYSLRAIDWESGVFVPTEPMIITEIDTPLLAGQVKLWLMTYLDGDDLITFFPPGEGESRSGMEIPLCELDRQPAYDHTCTLFFSGLHLQRRSRYGFADLLSVMARLRGPGGCPWDQEQTHESLRPYLLEEAYEAIGAIDEGDMDHVADELGDVLLQVVFHADIAKQHGDFDINDITTAICKKMIYRHAHIFGDDVCETAEDVLVNWEKLKKKERGIKTHGDALRDVPTYLPALMRAEKVQKKARQAGFDWDDPREALGKVLEESEEVRAELDAKADPGEELGDLLFACVNVARLCGLESEILLQNATEKFIRRFFVMENAAKSDGKALEDLTLSEMDVYWEAGKLLEQKQKI